MNAIELVHSTSWGLAQNQWVDFNWVHVESTLDRSSQDDGPIRSGFNQFITANGGWFTASATITFGPENPTSGYRAIRFRTIGGTNLAYGAWDPNKSPTRAFTLTWSGWLRPGSGIIVAVYQNSGANLTMPANTSEDPQRMQFCQVG